MSALRLLIYSEESNKGVTVIETDSLKEVIRVEEFEGYGVPKATEKQVREILDRKACGVGVTCGSVPCHRCLFVKSHDTPFKTDLVQRYLDHRWPKDRESAQQIAVHCATQEEWDRMCDETGRASKYAWAFYAKNSNGGINLDTDGTYSRIEFYESQGYKIISTQEYLGEWRDRPVYIDGKDIANHKPLNTKEEDMNNVIAEVYKDKKYEEVVMVNKHFGHKVADNDFGKILLEAHKDDVFAKAEALKKDEEEAKED